MAYSQPLSSQFNQTQLSPSNAMMSRTLSPLPTNIDAAAAVAANVSAIPSSPGGTPIAAIAAAATANASTIAASPGGTPFSCHGPQHRRGKTPQINRHDNSECLRRQSRGKWRGTKGRERNHRKRAWTFSASSTPSSQHKRPRTQSKYDRRISWRYALYCHGPQHRQGDTARHVCSSRSKRQTAELGLKCQFATHHPIEPGLQCQFGWRVWCCPSRRH